MKYFIISLISLFIFFAIPKELTYATPIIRGRIKDAKTGSYLPVPGAPLPELKWCSCLAASRGDCANKDEWSCIFMRNSDFTPPQSGVLCSSICDNWEESCGSGATGTCKDICVYPGGSTSAWKTPPCPSPFYDAGSGHKCCIDRSQHPEYNYNMWITDDVADMAFREGAPPVRPLDKPYFKFEQGHLCVSGNTYVTGVSNADYPGTFTLAMYGWPEGNKLVYSNLEIEYTPPNTPNYPTSTPAQTPDICTCDSVEIPSEISAGKTITITTYAKSLDVSKVLVKYMVYHVSRNGTEITTSEQIPAEIVTDEASAKYGMYYTKWDYTIPTDGAGEMNYRIWVDIACGYITAQNTSGVQVMGITTEIPSFFTSIKKWISNLFIRDKVKGIEFRTVLAPKGSTLKLGTFYPATDISKGCHEATFNLHY